jgi:hypothetical protein
MAFFLITFLYFIMRKLISTLARRQSGNEININYQPFTIIKKMLKLLIASLLNIRTIVMESIWLIKALISFNKPVSINGAYKKYLKWGTKKGIPRRKYETPNEYGQRLSNHFPLLGDAFDTITESFVAYSYSENNLPGSGGIQVNSALRKLYSYNIQLIRLFFSRLFKLREA